MAVIKGNARQSTSVQSVGEGVEVYQRMLRDGTVGIADLVALWSLEGRVFTCNLGTGTTAATFGGGTLDLTEHDMHVAVPSSVCIIPLEMTIVYETWGTVQICENVLLKGSGSVAGSGTAVTPKSSNENTGISSACTVTGACATGTAFTTVDIEIWRESIQRVVTITTVTEAANYTRQRFEWNALKSGVLQVVGPSEQLAVFASSQAGTGFIILKYAELPVARIQ